MSQGLGIKGLGKAACKVHSSTRRMLGFRALGSGLWRRWPMKFAPDMWGHAFSQGPNVRLLAKPEVSGGWK